MLWINHFIQSQKAVALKGVFVFKKKVQIIILQRVVKHAFDNETAWKNKYSHLGHNTRKSHAETIQERNGEKQSTSATLAFLDDLSSQRKEIMELKC